MTDLLHHPAATSGAPMPADPEAPYTVRQAAARLNLGVSTLYTMIQLGRIPSLRYGAAIRIPRETVEQMAKAGAPVLISEPRPTRAQMRR